MEKAQLCPQVAQNTTEEIDIYIQQVVRAKT